MTGERRRYVGLSDDGRRCGETHHNSTISDAVVEQLREMHASGLGPKSLKRIYPKISLRTIRAIVYFERRATRPVRWTRSTDPIDEQPGTADEE